MFFRPTCLVCAPHSVPFFVPGPRWPFFSAALPFSAGCGHPAWRLFQSPIWSLWSPLEQRSKNTYELSKLLKLCPQSLCACWSSWFYRQLTTLIFYSMFIFMFNLNNDVQKFLMAGFTQCQLWGSLVRFSTHCHLSSTFTSSMKSLHLMRSG